MPLFPAVIDNLRWDDLVSEGRAQLPLVAPDQTDQNTSDPAIAVIELVSWLVETESYRCAAVSDRERLLLLRLAGFTPRQAQAARCLVRLSTPTPRTLPAGLELDGDRDGTPVPLSLVDDVCVTGASLATVAWVGPGAADDDYRDGVDDLTRDLTAARVLKPLGEDPAVGDALLIGLAAPGGLPAGTLDLWFLAATGTSAPEVPDPGGSHHSAVTDWEAWDGSGWVAFPSGDVVDDTLALTRSGRVRVTHPALPEATLGDQSAGLLRGQAAVWLRCRLLSGRHDAAPELTGIHVDTGVAVAARPYSSQGNPGAALLGVASGVPDEELRLPQPWCDVQPTLWCDDGTPQPIRVAPDLAQASPLELAAALDPDGITVRFGDGHWGRTLPAGAQVFARGVWTTAAGIGDLRPPLNLTLGAGAVGATLVAGLAPGKPAEDVPELAARAERTLWVHDRLTEATQVGRATSLDDLPLTAVRELAVPERAVTALDFERLALATPGVAVARARALPEVDPRMPGLRAAGCVTVVVVPSLPAAAPEPTPGLLRRVRAHLAPRRTLGTRVFVVGPRYLRIGVSATLVLLPGARPDAATRAAEKVLRTFLHPTTGGPSGQGWPFGRTVRRTEILQQLDQVAGVDRVQGLVLSRERADGEPCASCGDIVLGETDLALAGTLALATAPGTRVPR